MAWKIIARHKWVTGATISESYNERGEHRFVATVRGWRNWKIWQGDPSKGLMKRRVELVKQRVMDIRARIDRGDETVFTEPNVFINGDETE